MSVPYIENIRPAPREVSLLLRLQLLFGGALSQMGWFFFGFGMIFVWVFAPNCDWRSMEYMGIVREYSQGIVSQVEATNFTEGGSKTRRGRTVYAYHYTFMKDGLLPHSGISYSSLSSLGEGSIVRVEYPQGNPQVSRIEGLRSAPFDLWVVLFVAIFPIVGIFFVIPALSNGRKAVQLLRNGVLGYGKLESVRYANMRINNRDVYRFMFRYMGANGITYRLKTLTENPEILQDEEYEQLLFDRGNQSNAVMLDTLPGGVSVNRDGSLAPAKVLYPIYVSILPLIVVASQIACVYLFFINHII